MHSILSIKGTADRGADYKFVVEMTDGKRTVSCVVTSAELTTYPGYQRAVLGRIGELFRDDTFATPRLGAGYWQDEIERHLSDNRKLAAPPCEVCR
jgi:hypothetical protein